MPKIKPEQLAEAEDLDFEDKKEVWNEYKLEDGSTLKVKLVLQGVKRLDKHTPDGKPIYVIKSRNMVRTLNVPEELKKEPKKKKESNKNAVTRYRT